MTWCSTIRTQSQTLFRLPSLCSFVRLTPSLRRAITSFLPKLGSGEDIGSSIYIYVSFVFFILSHSKILTWLYMNSYCRRVNPCDNQATEVETTAKKVSLSPPRAIALIYLRCIAVSPVILSFVHECLQKAQCRRPQALRSSKSLEVKLDEFKRKNFCLISARKRLFR